MAGTAAGFKGWWFPLVLAVALLAPPLAAQIQTQKQVPQPTALETDSQATRIDPQIEYLLDGSARLSADEIEDQPDAVFRPLQAGKPYVLGTTAMWMRFDASVNSPAARWRLAIPMPTLDEATLYYRNGKGQWIVQRSGDHIPRSEWSQRGRYPVFDLASDTSQNVRYYLRIAQLRMPYSTPPRILSDTEYIESRQNEQMLLGLYFGFVAVLAGLATFNAIKYRDAGFAVFALQALLFACAQGVLSGLAGLYVWPQTPGLNDSGNVMFNLCAAAASLWFARTVCTPMRYSVFFDRVMVTLIFMLPMVAVTDVFLATRASFIALNLVVCLALAALLVGIGIGLVERDRDTRWVALGFAPLLITALLLLARNLGMISGGFETDYGRLLAAMIGSPILFHGLWRRVSQSRNLSARATSLRNTDPLTGLYVTKVLLGKMRQSLATAERYHLPFAVLTVNLANLPGLQKQHGRETADRALVMAASRIRDIAHSTDTLARVGDGQFALLMEGPLKAESANDVATKILASGLRPSNQLPDAEPLMFHIAVGYMGPDAMMTSGKAEDRLAYLLQALMSMDDGSRKAIRQIRF
ncbi:MAG: 7TM diverse intracellular signaling domain-containing protein [Pseudomonadota bacterium]